MNRRRKAIIASHEISELRTYTLGGYPQKVLIEGSKKSNPIVIFLHGGPGTPIPFCVGCRGMFPEWTNQVTMVYWDQLGCGINNHVIDDSFCIEDFVNMTIQLIKQIKEEFPQNPINIFAVSWGSVLAARVVEAIPELIHKVLVYGQVLKELSFNEEVYSVLEKSDMPQKHKVKLQVIKQTATHSVEELKMLMKWIGKYTEGYQTKEGGKAPIGKIIAGLITSPDYSLKDLKAVVNNGYIKNQSLLTEMMGIDLSQTLKKSRVPYLMMQGDSDIVTSTKMIGDFVEASENKNLMFKQVANSGHFPSETGMDVIINTGFKFLQNS